MKSKIQKLKRGECVVCEGYGELEETTWAEARWLGEVEAMEREER